MSQDMRLVMVWKRHGYRVTIPRFLAERAMNADSWEVLFREKLSESHTPLNGPDEDNDLVEL